MAHIRQILANLSISESDFKKSPKTVIKAVKNEPIAVIIDNKPAFYCVPADILESLYQKFYEINDISLQNLQDISTNSSAIEDEENSDECFGVDDVFQSIEDEQETSLARSDVIVDPLNNQVADPLDDEVAERLGHLQDDIAATSSCSQLCPSDDLDAVNHIDREVSFIHERNNIDENDFSPNVNYKTINALCEQHCLREFNDSDKSNASFLDSTPEELAQLHAIDDSSNNSGDFVLMSDLDLDNAPDINENYDDNDALSIKDEDITTSLTKENATDQRDANLAATTELQQDAHAADNNNNNCSINSVPSKNDGALKDEPQAEPLALDTTEHASADNTDDLNLQELSDKLNQINDDKSDSDNLINESELLNQQFEDESLMLTDNEYALLKNDVNYSNEQRLQKKLEDKAALREVIRDVKQEIEDSQRHEFIIGPSSYSLEHVAKTYSPYYNKKYNHKKRDYDFQNLKNMQEIKDISGNASEHSDLNHNLSESASTKEHKNSYSYQNASLVANTLGGGLQVEQPELETIKELHQRIILQEKPEKADKTQSLLNTNRKKHKKKKRKHR